MKGRVQASARALAIDLSAFFMLLQEEVIICDSGTVLADLEIQGPLEILSFSGPPG
jgi:hypothetical protein